MAKPAAFVRLLRGARSLRGETQTFGIGEETEPTADRAEAAEPEVDEPEVAVPEVDEPAVSHQTTDDEVLDLEAGIASIFATIRSGTGPEVSREDLPEETGETYVLLSKLDRLWQNARAS